MNVLLRLFRGSVAVVLLLTAGAKLISAAGTARVLALPDPLLIISNRGVLVLAGSIELILASYLLLGRRHRLKVPLIAWLATNFLIYRIGLWLSGIHKPCGCLGTVTDAVAISPAMIDILMKIILAYLLVGSYCLLLIEWWHRRKRAGAKTDEYLRGEAQT